MADSLAELDDMTLRVLALLDDTTVAEQRREAIRDFTTAQIDKARELISDGGLVPTNRAGIFRAVSSRGDESYLVAAEAGICACPAGLHERRCYHVLAARLVNVSTRRAA